MVMFIRSLPSELLLKVVACLSTANFLALRLVCKDLDALLFQTFARQYFTRRQFMRSHFSLQALVDISTSRLAQYLQHVIIGCDYLGYEYIGSEHFWLTRQAVETRPLEDFSTDQTIFMSTGLDREMLTMAFSNLRPDVVGVGNLARETGHQYDPNIPSQSYGFEKQTGLKLTTAGIQSLRDHSRFQTQCFRVVIYALGKSRARPSRLEILMGRSGVAGSAFVLPSFMEQVVSPVISNLKALSVDLRMKPATLLGRIGCSIGNGWDPATSLTRFLENASNLSDLRINLITTETGGMLNTCCLRWLLDTKVWDNLRSLELGRADVFVDELSRLLRSLPPHLEHLILRRITLHDTNSESNYTNHWAAAVASLSGCKNIGSLERLQIHCPRQFIRGHADPIVFSVQGPRSDHLDLSGHDLGVWLARWAEDAHHKGSCLGQEFSVPLAPAPAGFATTPLSNRVVRGTQR